MERKVFYPKTEVEFGKFWPRKPHLDTAVTFSILYITPLQCILSVSVMFNISKLPHIFWIWHGRYIHEHIVIMADFTKHVQDVTLQPVMGRDS